MEHYQGLAAVSVMIVLVSLLTWWLARQADKAEREETERERDRSTP